MAHSHDHPKSHDHDHGGHDLHDHGGPGHVHAIANFGKAFALGMGLNAAFVVLEAACYAALTRRGGDDVMRPI